MTQIITAKRGQQIKERESVSLSSSASYSPTKGGALNSRIPSSPLHYHWELDPPPPQHTVWTQTFPPPHPTCYLPAWACPSMLARHTLYDTPAFPGAHSSLGFLLAVPILQSSLSGLPHPGTFSFLDLTLNPDLHLHVSRVQGGYRENFPGSWPCLRAFFLLTLSSSSFFFIPAPLVTSHKTWESSSPKRLKCMILCKKSIHGRSGLFPLPGAGDFIE